MVNVLFSGQLGLPPAQVKIIHIVQSGARGQNLRKMHTKVYIYLALFSRHIFLSKTWGEGMSRSGWDRMGFRSQRILRLLQIPLSPT